jgi:hypothetical protein
LSNPTLQEAILLGGIPAVVALVRTLCWCWKERCRRKTLQVLITELVKGGRRTRVSMDRERIELDGRGA